MKSLLPGASGWAAALLLTIVAFPSPSKAQTTYGPWFETNDCRPQRGQGGLFRGPQLPGTPRIGGGYQTPMECRWERIVRSCPRILRSMRDCSERRQQSGYSPSRPRG